MIQDFLGVRCDSHSGEDGMDATKVKQGMVPSDRPPMDAAQYLALENFYPSPCDPAQEIPIVPIMEEKELASSLRTS